METGRPVLGGPLQPIPSHGKAGRCLVPGLVKTTQKQRRASAAMP